MLLRQDIKDVLMDFKGCCIFLSNIPSSGAHKKNIESICSFIRACKTRPRMCCWRKKPEIKETYIDNASLKILGNQKRENWIRSLPSHFLSSRFFASGVVDSETVPSCADIECDHLYWG